MRGIVIRRLGPRLAALALTGLAGCASPGMPPGGPPDETAPKLLRISPDSNARDVRPRNLVFQFDEVINERSSGTAPGGGGGASFGAGGGGGGGGSASSLTSLFLVSPMSGDLDVNWHRSRIDVRPRKGWRTNTTYVVQLLPGISDLRNNRDTVGRTFVFSTGPDIATGLLTGQVFDWIPGRVAAGAWVEARPSGDTTLAYIAVADTLGRFRITHLPPGSYLLRGIIDQNHNRGIDPREAFDSATVVLRDSLTREMLAFPHDTIGAGIATVDVRDSTQLKVTFDRAVDIRQQLTPATFTLTAADSSVVPIASVVTGVEAQRQDSLRRAAREDSTRRAAEAVADSARRADSLTAVAEGRRPTPQVPTRRAPAPRPDTAKRAAPPPRPSVPSPSVDFVLRLGEPLKPGTNYRLRADSVRNLLGHPRTSERQFTTAKAQAPDTTAAGRDSTRRGGAARPRRGAPAAGARPDTTRARPDTTRVRPDTTRRVRPDTSARSSRR